MLSFACLSHGKTTSNDSVRPPRTLRLLFLGLDRRLGGAVQECNVRFVVFVWRHKRYIIGAAERASRESDDGKSIYHSMLRDLGWFC